MRHLILAVAFLSGCTSVVPTGIARLSAVSPMEADPADIAVALSLPTGIGVTTNSANLNLMASRTDTDQSTAETYVLASMMGSDGSTIYAVAPADYARLRDQQALIRQWKGENSKATSGSLGVTLEPCTTGAGPTPDATVTIKIRTSSDGQFFPILRNAPVTDVLQQGNFRPIQSCP